MSNRHRPFDSPFFAKAFLVLLVFFGLNVQVFGQFVHPGISHKLSDLERMKLMIEAGEEPWLTSFNNLRNHSRAQHDRSVGGLDLLADDPNALDEFNSLTDNFLINDSTTAYLNALMWYFTGDARHAEKAIEVFNTHNRYRRNVEIPLVTGRIVRLLEAAEIIRHTYDGWDPADIQAFEDMLVYPGYSNTTIPQAAINSRDVSFYWTVYNGDPSRIGNQGISAIRVMMAMGIFMDNEIMYDRAVRMLRGQPHRPDDVPYQSGPAINGGQQETCDFYEQHDLIGFESTIPDFGFNEVIGHYIYENGQSQEADRDQAHAIGGVACITGMCEIAWNQGDDVFSNLDNRPLLGLEYYIRYNLSDRLSFPDQPEPWEPTVESGEFFQRFLRNGRRFALKINPGVNCDQDRVTRGGFDTFPVYELPLAHYRDRMGLPSNDYKWLERGHDYLVSQIGVEGITDTIQVPLYGSLFYRRVSPGDPISGFDSDGLPEFAMNELPMTVEAENFDYFPADGQGRTYSDSSSGNSGGVYRFDSDVDIQESSEGDTYIGLTRDGEFLTYTVNVPETGNYNIQARVSTRNDVSSIRFSFGGEDKTGLVAVPNTGGFLNWVTIPVAQNVPLTRGVQQVRVDIVGGAFTFDNFAVNELIVGDFNGDAVIDCDDLDAYIGNIGEAATGSLAALDFDLDGVVEFSDANLLASFLIETSNGVIGLIPGDLNCDGQVDVLGDAFVLIGSLGNSVTSYSAGDINLDGVVDVLNDAFLLIGNLGSSNE